MTDWALTATGEEKRKLNVISGIYARLADSRDRGESLTVTLSIEEMDALGSVTFDSLIDAMRAAQARLQRESLPLSPLKSQRSRQLKLND